MSVGIGASGPGGWIWIDLSKSCKSRVRLIILLPLVIQFCLEDGKIIFIMNRDYLCSALGYFLCLLVGRLISLDSNMARDPADFNVYT